MSPLPDKPQSRASEHGLTDRVFDAAQITRPDPSLLSYYLLVALCSLPLFPIVLVPLWIRYQTMQYRFDDDGVSMSWGFFFRKEVYLTYGRLQDIHVTRNIIERWMGLAKMPIQTASGAHGATMTIEGIKNPEPLRDFLYSRMRGAADESPETGDSSEKTVPETTQLLMEIRDHLKAVATREGAS